MNQELFLSAIYDLPLPDGCIKQGTYGEDRCGGPVHWIITNTALSEQQFDTWSIPYHSERYLYVFSFYSETGFEHPRLWDFYQHIDALHKYKGNDVPEYIVLTNTKITTRELSGDPDDNGGTVEFADLQCTSD